MGVTDPPRRRRIRLSLRTRLILGYGGILLLLALFGGLSIYQFNQMLEAHAILIQETHRALAAEELSRASLELVIAIDKGILLEDGKKFVALVSPALDTLEQRYERVRATLTDTLHLDTTLASITSVVRPMLIQAESEDSWRLIRDNRLSRIDDKIERLSQAIEQVIRTTQDHQAQALAQATAAQQTIHLYLLGSFVFAVLLGIYMVYSIIRSITRPVRALVASAGRLAAGAWDQRVTVDAEDEVGQLGRAFNEMAEQLQAVYSSLEQRVIERTRALEQWAVKLQAAAQVTREAAAIRDVDLLLDHTVHIISDQFGFYHAGLFLLDEAGTYAVLRAASSEGGRQMLAQGHKLKVGAVGIVGHVAGAGQPRIALDVGADAVFFDNPNLPYTRSEMALPLRARERIIGVLDVQSTTAAAFTEEDVAILQTLADHVALAIENARLLAETQARLQEISELLGRASREGWTHLATERPGWGYIYDGVAVAPLAAGQLPETGSPLTIPLQVRGASIGRLQLTLADRQPAAEDIALAQAVVDQAGLALESARLYQDTRHRAARERLISEVTARIRESLDTDAVLQTAVREMRQALGIAEVEVRLGVAQG